MRIVGFEWDHANWPKCGKHGATQAEIEFVLSGHPDIYPDTAHSRAEQRFLAIGQTNTGRHLLIAFTVRHHRIRLISTRFMHAPASCEQRRSATMSTAKKIPPLMTDEAAERFVDEADLTHFDLSGFKPTRFEFEKKAAQINMRVPKPLLEAVKSKAQARGMPFTRYIRMLMEQDIAGR